MTHDSRQGMPLMRAVPAQPMNLPAVAMSTTRTSMPNAVWCGEGDGGMDGWGVDEHASCSVVVGVVVVVVVVVVD